MPWHYLKVALYTWKYNTFSSVWAAGVWCITSTFGDEPPRMLKVFQRLGDRYSCHLQGGVCYGVGSLLCVKQYMASKMWKTWLKEQRRGDEWSFIDRTGVESLVPLPCSYIDQNCWTGWRHISIRDERVYKVGSAKVYICALLHTRLICDVHKATCSFPLPSGKTDCVSKYFGNESELYARYRFFLFVLDWIYRRKPRNLTTLFI
jgi:hypothetical protein